jgi:release factor glutamine methyltransferase
MTRTGPAEPPAAPATAAQALAAARARLRDAGLPDPAADARRLLAHALDLPADRLTLHLPDPMAPAAAARLDAALAARLRRQPVAQIVGGRLFWGRRFAVSGDVLDPRPETETLIAEALVRPAARVLDLGTGTGCILLTLLAEWPGAVGTGIDASAAALTVARANAAALGVAERADLVPGDWTVTGWADALDGPFDLIVSNPPYISEAEMAALSPEVRDWEPHAALCPGGDGLGAYRAILPPLSNLLAPGGRVLLETGPAQGAPVSALARAAGLTGVRVLPDLDGRDRVVCAHENGQK